MLRRGRVVRRGASDAESLVSSLCPLAGARRAALPRQACSSSCGRRPTQSGTAATGRPGGPRARCPSAAPVAWTRTRRRLDLRPGMPWLLLPLGCTAEPNSPPEHSPPRRLFSPATRGWRAVSPQGSRCGCAFRRTRSISTSATRCGRASALRRLSRAQRAPHRPRPGPPDGDWRRRSDGARGERDGAGPSTVRLDSRAHDLVQCVASKHLKTAIITTPSGCLVGVFRRADAESHLAPGRRGTALR